MGGTPTVGLPGGQLGFLIVVNIMVFFLAFFLDFFELSFIVVPLLAPVADKLGIDLIWFGVLLAINMQTSFMHPPFGFALFYLRSVAPAKEYMDKVTKKMIAPVTTTQIYWGAIPFLCIQILMVALVIAFLALFPAGWTRPRCMTWTRFASKWKPTCQHPWSRSTPRLACPDPEAPAAEDDPLKAMQESLSQDAEKKN